MNKVKIKIKRFNSLTGMQNYFKYNDFEDIFKYKGLVYTQEEYDNSGEVISYRNKNTTNGIYLRTSNRYDSKQDLKIELFLDEGFYRNDINYYE